MFSAYTRELTYTDRIHSFYFYKDHGAIINTSFMMSDNKFFKQLQNNISVALKPLIELVNTACEEEMSKYTSTGGTFSKMPQNHPASILLNLKCILEANEKFFGIYKQPLPHNAIPNNSSFNSIDAWSKALADLTHVDYKEAYKFLLKLNACKKQYYFVDSLNSNLPPDDRFVIRNKGSEDDYKKGIQEIISFADFQKKIEKSIAYIISKTTQKNNSQNQL